VSDEDMPRQLLLLSTIVVFGLAAPAGAQPATSQPDVPVIVTQGFGTVKAPPDRAWVTIAAESRAKGPKEAQKMNAAAMSAVLEQLKRTGLAENAIQTTSYDLQPEFDYRDGRQTLRGYVARNTIEVRVDDLPKLGEILELAVTSGATSVSGVRFDLKDRDTAEREAIKRAVADARARAEAAAAGAGATIDRIVRIEEHRSGPMPPPRPMMMATRETLQVSDAPPVAPGELEIRATVTLTVAIRP
jgi:uncharacterized protein YggE